MQLPKIDYPTTSITIPDTKKKVLFRPMLVKEEKMLLMAKASDDETDIFSAIKQVVTNCCLDPTFNINHVPLYALEYIFIRLRGFSIGETLDISYKDYNDDKVYDFKINLSEVVIKYPEHKIDPKIAITPKTGIVMKYPSTELYDDKPFLKTVGEDSFYYLIIKCIEQVYDVNNVYEAKDFEEKDLLEFIEMIDVKTFKKIKDFLTNLPTLYYKIDYKNSLGEDRKIELTTLSDFFTLR